MNRILNDIVDIRGRVGWKGYTVDDLRDTGPWVIGANDITADHKLRLDNAKHISREKFEESPEIKIERNDILIVKVGSTIGKVAIVNFEIGEACINPNSVLLKNCREDPYYLYYYLVSGFGQSFLLNNSSASAQSALNQTTLKEMPIIFPKPEVQRKISKVLSVLDDKIELNNQINEELGAMAKLIYEYWFVQFDFPFDFAQGKSEVTSSGVEKPYKSSGGKMVWNKELKREIPEGWEIVGMEDLAEFNPSLKIERNSEAPYLGMTAISTTGYMTDLPEKKEFSGGIKFQNGDIVVARITPCLENGKTALITMLEEGSIGFGSTEFINIRAKEKSHVTFLAILSRSDPFRHYAISKMTGTSGRKRVDAKELAKFQLAKPPSELLKKYDEIVNPYFEKMTINSKQNQKLASLRDWLLPMLMNGQVTVVDAEEMVEEKLGMVAEERGMYNAKK